MSRRESGERGRFVVDESERVDNIARGEPVVINCGRERFLSRGRRVRVAMVGVYQELECKIDQSLDKTNKKGGQETTRRCLERAGVCSPSPGQQTNGEPRLFQVGPGLDKQETKQTRRASILISAKLSSVPSRCASITTHNNAVPQSTRSKLCYDL